MTCAPTSSRFARFAPGPQNRWSTLGLCLSVVVLAQCGTHKLEGVGPDPTRGQPGSGGRSSGTGATFGTGGSGIGASGGVADACGMNTGGSAPSGGVMTATTPVFTDLGTAAVPPPPISGGTLIVLRDGVTAVAADPDRDFIFVVDLSDVTNPVLRRSIPLAKGSEPGRLVEDGAGQVHVVLRSAGALVSVDPVTGNIAQQRSVCALPRGLAYEAAKDRLHVACAGGELVTLTPTGVTPERTLKLDQDLRDVVIDGGRLMVTRFRSAEILAVDGAGAVAQRIVPPTLVNTVVHSGSPFEPAIAWRAVGMPGGGVAMIHQRGMKGKVDHRPGGYGGPGCDGIVHTSVTVVKNGEMPVAGPAMAGFVLPVDLALSGDGKRVAMVAAGNGRTSNAKRVFITNLDDVALEWGSCGNDGKHGPPGRNCSTGTTSVGGRSGSRGSGGAGGIAGGIAGDAGGIAGDAGGTGGAGGAGGAGGRVAVAASTPAMCNDLPRGVEPTAVAFVGVDTVVVQTREPAQLWILQKVNEPSTAVVPAPLVVSLSEDSRADIGHAVFHSNSGGGLACASCHPEGHEDGRVWNFECEGERRTQDIGGGISGTEPFHWNGNLGNFATLVDTVFVGRMSGPILSTDQAAAALTWINSIPARPALRDAAEPQVARGRALFGDTALGCTTCHAGSLLTSNATVDVGTSQAFQVPSLRGVGWRAPYMHNGCAPDLAARFATNTCGGGDAHGKTSQLTPTELGDLIAYLESL